MHRLRFLQHNISWRQDMLQLNMCNWRRCKATFPIITNKIVYSSIFGIICNADCWFYYIKLMVLAQVETLHCNVSTVITNKIVYYSIFGIICNADCWFYYIKLMVLAQVGAAQQLSPIPNFATRFYIKFRLLHVRNSFFIFNSLVNKNIWHIVASLVNLTRFSTMAIAAIHD